MRSRNLKKRETGNSSEKIEIKKTIFILLLTFSVLGILIYINLSKGIKINFLNKILQRNSCEITRSIQKDIEFVAEIATKEGTGTGFLVDSGNFLVTNQHVVGNSQTVRVSIPGKFSSWGKVVWKDEKVDLALVSLSDNSLQGSLVWGNSTNTKIGETVAAIGFPYGETFGIEASVTKGTLSAKRSLNFGDMELLQTDTTINPGNSGGPLINECGEVIGVNQSKCDIVNLGCEGIGFAISSSKARPLIEEQISNYLKTSSKIDDISQELAVAIVKKYYLLINSKKYSQAYFLLSDDYKSTYSYEAWLVNIESVKSVSIKEMKFNATTTPTVSTELEEISGLGGRDVITKSIHQWVFIKNKQDWKLDQEQIISTNQ